MTRDLAANISAEFGGRLFHALIAGLLLVFLTRTLGAESYGIYALAVSVFAISRLFSELGLARSAARYVAEYKDEDPGTADTVVTESIKIALLTAIAVAVVLAVSADRIAALLDEPSLASVLLVGSALVLFHSLHRYNRTLLQGFERVRTSAKLHATEGAFTGVFVVALVLYRPTAVSAVVGYALGFAAVTVVGFHAVNSARDGDRRTSVYRNEIRVRILKYNVPLTVTRLSGVVDRQVDVLLVGYFLNPLAVAYYMIGKELSRLVTLPAAAVGFALSPTYGAQKAAGRTESAASIYAESLKKALVFYVPACTGIVLVAAVAIPTVFGAEYAGAIPVVRILALFIFFEGLAKISNYTLDYLGQARTRAMVKSITSVGNFGINVLLIPLVGVEGAAIATVITHGVYSLSTVYLVYTELGFDIAPVGRSLARLSAVTVVMGMVVYALLQAFTGFVAMIAGIGSGVGIWLFGCYALNLIDYDRLPFDIQE